MITDLGLKFFYIVGLSNIFKKSWELKNWKINKIEWRKFWLKVVSEKIPLHFLYSFCLSFFFAIFVPWFFIGTQSGGTNCWSNEFAHLESFWFFIVIHVSHIYSNLKWYTYNSNGIPGFIPTLLMLIHYSKAHKSIKV
jgi:hypothetical protein